MSKPEVVHTTFVITRTYPASCARVFSAFADDAVKRRWFLAEDQGSEVDAYSNDFRVGGIEKSRFTFSGSGGSSGGAAGGPPAGTQMGNDCVYMDIVKDERIVFAYAMLVGDRRMSASLATVVLTPSGDGTLLTFTEQAAFFGTADGPELRKNGWTDLLAKIATAIA